MNRFFSKLDLRDIKIDPKGSSFPPDGDEGMETDEPTAQEVAAPDHDGTSMSTGATAIDDQPARQPHVPAWASAQPASASTSSAPAGLDLHAAQNGHAEGMTNGVLSSDEAYDVQSVQSGDVLKVSARSRPSAVAGAIAGVVRESGRAEVQAIGAGATNQAVKAVAIARDYLRETGIEAICLPAFIDVTIENEDRTAIRLVVEPR